MEQHEAASAQEQARDRSALAQPVVLARILVALSAVTLGIVGIVATDWDRALCWAILAFGAFTAVHVAFDALAISLGANPPREEFARIVGQNQTTVLTITGTTLGLLSAFTEKTLAPATKAAVCGFVAAALLQFLVQASGARLEANPRSVRTLGLAGDLVAFALLSFGLIALASSLLAQQ